MRNNYPYNHSHHGGYCGYLGPTFNQLPPQTVLVQYDPIYRNMSFTGQDITVPVVQPSCTTNVYQKSYKYMHLFPRTESIVCQETNEHFYAPPCPPRSCPWC
ncbi:CotD family spore coat protein [Priestia aryabhattai]|uniref:CotD family spore coat protein n=1 Tax=Priestia megaterium TaxID=1404 RepID=UPI0039B9C3BF